MNLELDFLPDTVVYLKYKDGSFSNHTLWGLEDVYLNGIDYIQSLCNNKSSFIALKKGLGKIKILHHEI